MATDKKISELPDATLPIATGVKFEALQGGINVKVDADDMPGSGASGVTSVAGTTNRITSTGGATPVIDIDAAYDAAITAEIAAAITAATVGVQDLFIPASAMWPRVTSGCSVLTQYEMTTSLFNVQGLEFSNTVQQFAQFQVTLPRKWNNGTITAVVYWKPLESGTGDVQWGISGGAYSNDDALTVALGTAVTVDDTFIATDDLHVTAATSAITLAGTPADADFLALQISRNPGSDTLDVNAVLLGISIRISTDAAKDA